MWSSFANLKNSFQDLRQRRDIAYPVSEPTPECVVNCGSDLKEKAKGKRIGAMLGFQRPYLSTLTTHERCSAVLLLLDIGRLYYFQRPTFESVYALPLNTYVTVLDAFKFSPIQQCSECHHRVYDAAMSVDESMTPRGFVILDH